MNLGLEGKVAVITGGTRGIGLAVARLLATEGADVVLVSRNADEAVWVADDIARPTGRRVLGLAADTTDDAAVSAMGAAVEFNFNGAHILVNCAAEPAGQKAVPVPSEADWASMAENVLMGRLPTADDVAQVIAFLVSPRSVAINGVAIDVGGGVRGAINY